MNSKRGSDSISTIFALMIVMVLLVGVFMLNLFWGVGVFGPTVTHDCTVNRLYVDYSGSGDNKESNYMVGTSDGVFECDNSWLLWLWNADEMYSALEQGKQYRITTVGNKVTGWFFQEYPYVTKVERVP